MANADNFKPGAGGMQVSVVGAQQNGVRELGKNFAMGSAPASPVLGQAPLPSHQQAQIGQSNAPKGAQPVSFMGQPAQGVPILGQGPRMPMSPAAQPAPFLSKAPSLDGEVHTIVVEGRGTDGKKYVAEFDAVFPRGTKVLGVTEKVSE